MDLPEILQGLEVVRAQQLAVHGLDDDLGQIHETVTSLQVVYASRLVRRPVNRAMWWIVLVVLRG